MTTSSPVTESPALTATRANDDVVPEMLLATAPVKAGDAKSSGVTAASRMSGGKQTLLNLKPKSAAPEMSPASSGKTPGKGPLNGIQFPPSDGRDGMFLHEKPKSLGVKTLSSVPEALKAMDAVVLPFVLWDGREPVVAISLKKAKEDACCFSGGAIFFASTHPPPPAGQPQCQTPMSWSNPEFNKALLGSLTPFVPMMSTTMHHRFPALMWRLKHAFKNLELTAVVDADFLLLLEDALKAKAHVDLHRLYLSRAPPHVENDLKELPIKTHSKDIHTLREHESAWRKTSEQWKAADGRPPCHPVPTHDSRAAMLSSRTGLLDALEVMRDNAVTGQPLGKELLELANNPKVVAPPPAPAVAANAEDAALRAMMLPPPPKSKPERKRKDVGASKKGAIKNGKKQKKLTGGAFIDYEAQEKGSDDDESEGEEAEDGFISDNDDVYDDPQEKKKKKEEKKRKAPASDEDSGSDDDDGSGSDDEEEEELSSSDDQSDEAESSEDEGRQVTAAAAASEDSGDDDDKPVRRMPRSVSSTKRPVSKKACVISDEDEDETLAQRSTLFAQQMMTGVPTAGKPPAKMGASKAHALSEEERAADKADKGTAPEKPVAPAKAPAKVPAKSPAKSPVVSAPVQPLASKSGSGRDYARQSRERIVNACADSTRATMAAARELAYTAAPAMVDKALTDKMGNLTELMEEFRSNNATDHYNACLESMIAVMEVSTSVFIAALRAKSKDTFVQHGKLGLVGAQALSKLLPGITALSAKVSQAMAEANTLQGSANGLAAKLAEAVAEAQDAEAE